MDNFTVVLTLFSAKITSFSDTSRERKALCKSVREASGHSGWGKGSPAPHHKLRHPPCQQQPESTFSINSRAEKSESDWPLLSAFEEVWNREPGIHGSLPIKPGSWREMVVTLNHVCMQPPVITIAEAKLCQPSTDKLTPNYLQSLLVLTKEMGKLSHQLLNPLRQMPAQAEKQKRTYSGNGSWFMYERTKRPMHFFNCPGKGTKSKMDEVALLNTRESDFILLYIIKHWKKKRNQIIKCFHTFYGSIL